MWSKIYVSVLGVSILIMTFFSYYSWSWLQSIGAPAAAAAGYEYHAGIGGLGLWILTAVLLILGNGAYWTSNRLWPLWCTFAFFAAFSAIGYFWLEPSYFALRKENGLVDANFSARPFIGVVLILAMAAIVFADQFIMIRMRSKTYPEPIVVIEPDSTESQTNF